MAIPLFVTVLWWGTLIVTLVAVVPLVVVLLHRAFRAAREIEHYAAATLEAGLGVAGNTANISALETTIGLATQILGVARSLEEHTGTIRTVLAARAGEIKK